MANKIFCCVLIFICFLSVLGKPVKPQKVEKTGCNCTDFVCGCCADIIVPQISLNNTICLNFGYEPKSYGISLLLTIDEKALINETISATNPPPIFFHIPYIRGLIDGCIRFSDLSISNKKFHGCAQLELRMWHLYVVAEYKLGCFDINDISKPHSKLLKLISKSKNINKTVKENVAKLAFIHPKSIQ